MLNIASIYRFNTPFLDIKNETEKLVSVIKKVEKSLKIDWIRYTKQTSVVKNYYKVSLVFADNLWNIDFYYIDNISDKQYFLPIFKLDINLNEKFFVRNNERQAAVKFLNNIFECFDWLTEREFLIDLNNDFYYEVWVFKTKIYPSYDFSDIEQIREAFESNHGILIVEDFISKFSNSSYVLSYEGSKYFYEIHSIFLYFIYLVYLMNENIEKTKQANVELDQDFDDIVYESQKELMRQRLSYVEHLHYKTFEQYKEKLDLFFKLF